MSRQKLPNPFNYPLNIPFYFFIPKPYYPQAQLFQFKSALLIVFGLANLIMTPAIDLYHQPFIVTVKIGNKLANGMLPPEFKTRYLPFPQSRPQGNLGICHLLAKGIGHFYNGNLSPKIDWILEGAVGLQISVFYYFTFNLLISPSKFILTFTGFN
jgi:hypothetical protein